MLDRRRAKKTRRSAVAAGDSAIKHSFQRKICPRADADPSAKALLNALLDVCWSNTKPCEEAKPSRFSYRNRRAVRRWVFPVA
jgi:hypothetical protein